MIPEVLVPTGSYDQDLWYALWNGEDQIWSEVDHKYLPIPDDIELVAKQDLTRDDHTAPENIFVVVRYEGKLYRRVGFYASYDGLSWTGEVEEVEPYVRQVQDYRKVVS